MSKAVDTYNRKVLDALISGKDPLTVKESKRLV